jgi:hypothetical protein
MAIDEDFLAAIRHRHDRISRPRRHDQPMER